MQLLERDDLILQREFNLEYRQSIASAYYVRASPSDVFFSGGMSRLILVALAEFWAKAAGVALWGDGGARENTRTGPRGRAANCHGI